MPRGDKSAYTDKQKRQADHIEEGYEKRGVPEAEAESRAWATVNKISGGGKKSGSGRGKPTNKAPMQTGGKKGGAASAKRRPPRVPPLARKPPRHAKPKRENLESGRALRASVLVVGQAHCLPGDGTPIAYCTPPLFACSPSTRQHAAGGAPALRTGHPPWRGAKRIPSMRTPALLLDRNILERNCARIADLAHARRVRLRPHLKTAKSTEVAAPRHPGHFGGVTVSTVAEVQYFAAHGWRDLTYAVGIAPDKIPALAAVSRGKRERRSH